MTTPEDLAGKGSSTIPPVMLEEGRRVFSERAVVFTQIDQATLQSRLLERHLAAFRAAGLKGSVTFGISDAQENAYGMGFPMLTRTMAVISEDMDRYYALIEGEFIPFRGGVIFQINRGHGFEEPMVDFQLTDEPAYNFAKRFDDSQYKDIHTAPHPYWLQVDALRGMDITQPQDLIPNRASHDGFDSAYLFKGNSRTCVPVSKFGERQQDIEAYFEELATSLKGFATGSAS